MDGKKNSNFKYDPYIKVYNGPYSSASEVARIYLKDAGVDYTHSDRFKKFNITTNIGKRINEIMAENITIQIRDNKGNLISKTVSTYEYLWILLNERFDNNITYIPCPDFTKCHIRPGKKGK
jgi:hypothetical protein